MFLVHPKAGNLSASAAVPWTHWGIRPKHPVQQGCTTNGPGGRSRPAEFPDAARQCLQDFLLELA